MSDYDASTAFGGRESAQAMTPSLGENDQHEKRAKVTIGRPQSREARPSSARDQSPEQSKLRSGPPGTRHYPVCYNLVDLTFRKFYTELVDSKTLPSQEVVLEGAILSGLEEMNGQLSMTSKDDLAVREFNSDGTEKVWWVPQSYLCGLKPTDPKGYLELALIAALEPDIWQEEAVEAPPAPTARMVAGLFTRARKQSSH